MRLLKKRRAKHLPDEEYKDLTVEASELDEQIRDLQGFIGKAPKIREERRAETQVTLPPPEEDENIPEVFAHFETDGEEIHDGEDSADRLGRRHLMAIKKARRKNFCIFLVMAAAVSAFLYWVSLVVQ